jgi:putative methyltransferase
MKAKKNVYVLQINTPTDRNLLPLAAGLLVSYARSIPDLDDAYNFSIEILRQNPETTVASLSNPEVLALSCYSWNLRQNLKIAKLVKRSFPHCLVVLGGPSSPSMEHELRSFFAENVFIDVCVHGEGEFTFSEILKIKLEGRPLSSITGISYRSPLSTQGFFTTQRREPIYSLDILPSPFLDGTFDELLQKHRELITGTLWETNRGCPFSCTFCYWGQLQRSKLRTFSLARLYAELDWISSNKIGYVYATDGNFGVLGRDVEIAERVAQCCRQTGYPWHFMVNWTKHSSETVLNLAAILRAGRVGFNVTLSIQSFNEETLKAVKRVNLNTERFDTSIRESNQRKFSTYTDLIMALPCETFESFVRGLDHVFKPYLHYHYSVYLCRLLTGSEMNTPEYLDKYGIKTRNCSVEMGRRETIAHGEPEYEDIVVSTSSLSIEDWKKLYCFSYLTIPLYNYRLAFFVLNYLKFACGLKIREALLFVFEEVKNCRQYPVISRALKIIEDVSDKILSNDTSVTTSEFTGTLKWEPYEAALLSLLSEKSRFYLELRAVIDCFLRDNTIQADLIVLDEVFAYQQAIIPVWKQENVSYLNFQFTVSAFFDSLCRTGTPVEIRRKPHLVQFGTSLDHWEEAKSFAASRLIGGHTFHILETQTNDV